MKDLRFLCLVSFLFSYTFGFAQFGAKLGTNFSAAGSYGNSEEGENAELKVGYQVGVFYTHTINEQLGLLIELNYEAKGTISEKDYTIQFPVQNPADGSILGIGDYAISQEINSVQNYLNIPILLTFGGAESKFKYYVGPNIGFFLSGKADFKRTIDINLGGNPLPAISADISDIDWKDYDSFKQIFTSPPAEDGNFLNAFDLGINIGASYAFTENFFLDLRVSQGLLDVTNNHYDNSIYPDETFMFASRDDADRNFSFQLSVGYKF